METRVHLIAWEFEVPAVNREEFERVYGGAGDWAAFFARAAGYLGTSLLRDVARPGTYVTIDRWRSENDFLAFLECARPAYEALDLRCRGLASGERRLGAFVAPGDEA